MFASPKSSKPTATTKAAVTRTTLNRIAAAASPLKKPLSAATVSKLQRSASATGESRSAGRTGGSLKSAASRSSLLSDTTQSICSLASSQATSTAVAATAPATVAPSSSRPEIKKSSSSLSSASIASARRATSTTSFSGIKRPLGASKPARAGGNFSSASSSCSSAATAAASSNSSTAAMSRRVPTLAMSLRDKDQQIKLLIKERDEKKFQAELMARQAEEWREKFEASEVERSHMTSEADDEVVELRRLAQEFEDENKTLGQRLAEREQCVGDLQFKFVEMQCERDELTKELEFKEDQLQQLERERRDQAEGLKSGPEIVTERAISKAKYEREIEDLKEKITSRDEQMMQLRTSLEMRKQEVQNLQQHTADLERRLRIESERSERHLKRIDEVNLELKAADAKLCTKTEENEVQEGQIKQLRHDLRQAEEKLEQISLARKKDVDILHNKLSAARRGSTTPSGGGSPQPPPYKTPTPQDEIVRLQMEIRDLKDQLIDREAELDCNRRDLEVIKRKMETRTLEVDCNNQELARRCQDLLEQNRQSEDTIKQLLRSTTEHSASLMRATEDLKEANGKCLKLREEISELELKLDEQLKQVGGLTRENKQLKKTNEDREEQVEMLRQQVDSLNGQIGDLCAQLDIQTNNLHKDRELLADQLSEHEINAAQLRHDLATARQDLRTQKLQQQEISTDRDRLRSDLELKERYIKSRNEVLETMRHELDDCRKSLGEHKLKLDSLRSASQLELDESQRELKNQTELLRRDFQLKLDECNALKSQCADLQLKLDELSAKRELEDDDKFDEMRRKHSEEMDELHLRIQALEEELEEARTATLKSAGNKKEAAMNGSQSAANGREEKDQQLDVASKQTYESEIEFLNSVVVDMQRKCDSYRSQLDQIEQSRASHDTFDRLLLMTPVNSSQSSIAEKQQQQQQQQPVSRASTLKRGASINAEQQHQDQKQRPLAATMTRQRVVRIQDPLDELLQQASYSPAPPTRHISGRPYCDICQIYDTHHTIYCPRVSEKLASRNHDSADSAPTNGANNNGVYPNGYSNQTVDNMFREYVEAFEGAGGKQVSCAPFTSLRRPTKQQSERTATRLHCEICDLFGHSAPSCNMIKTN